MCSKSSIFLFRIQWTLVTPLKDINFLKDLCGDHFKLFFFVNYYENGFQKNAGIDALVIRIIFQAIL